MCVSKGDDPVDLWKTRGPSVMSMRFYSVSSTLRGAESSLWQPESIPLARFKLLYKGCHRACHGRIYRISRIHRV